jgi:hypothetical protein
MVEPVGLGQLTFGAMIPGFFLLRELNKNNSPASNCQFSVHAGDF